MDGKMTYQGAKWAVRHGFLASQNMASPSVPNMLKKDINFPNTFSTYNRYTQEKASFFFLSGSTHCPRICSI